MDEASPDFTSSYVRRIDSGDTDDSNFSNLVTPTDEQEIDFMPSGIEARLAKDLGGLDKLPPADVVLESALHPQQSEEYSPPMMKVDAFNPGLPKQMEQQKKSGLLSLMPPPSQVPESMTAIDSSTSVSSLPSASELRIQSRRKSSALYRLPNRHISDEDITRSDTDGEGHDTIRLEDFIPSMIHMDPTTDLYHASWAAGIQSLANYHSLQTAALALARVLLFLPWCIAVGAAITLSPSHLDSVLYSDSAFTGFVNKPSSPIHQFAYLAQYGFEHITIFAGAVSLILWMLPNIGWLSLAGIAAQFTLTWANFVEDQTTALGEDPCQTVYLLAKTIWWTGETEDMEVTDGHYYLTCRGPSWITDPQESEASLEQRS